MQLDSCQLGFTLRGSGGSVLTPTDLLDVEIALGPLVKTWRRKELHFSEGKWLFPLSQQESSSFWPGHLKCQVRVLWNNGVVEGKALQGLDIRESISKEVL